MASVAQPDARLRDDVENGALRETAMSSPVLSEKGDKDAITMSRLRARLFDDVSLTWAELPILACSFVSGLVDSVSFNAGAVFVSMQTGRFHISSVKKQVWS